MRVIKLVNSDFSLACKVLAERCMDFEPDIIIGIKTGGAIVLDEMMMANIFESRICRDDMIIRRVSTKGFKDKNFVKGTIKMLPNFAIMLLRKFEMFLSEAKAGYKTPEREIEIDLREETLQLIKKGSSILIVDDAIDTGSTMKIAKEYLHKLNPQNKIEIASLTVTHKKPVIKPKYFLYDRTILQFPWSLDT